MKIRYLYHSGYQCGQVYEDLLYIHIYLIQLLGLAENKNKEQLINLFYKSGLKQVGGLLTTVTTNTNQQWDSPNAWAPLVLLIIEGLLKLDIPAGALLAVSAKVS
jgi:neutral trehalase